MAGTVAGGKLAAKKNLEKNPNFYREIALKAQESWKANGRKPRGFAHPSANPVESGAKGGRISRRAKKGSA